MSEIKILSASEVAENPVIGQMANMGHDFRHAQRECDAVMSEIERFIKV